jgi:hypothetical protein
MQKGSRQKMFKLVKRILVKGMTGFVESMVWISDPDFARLNALKPGDSFAWAGDVLTLRAVKRRDTDFLHFEVEV